MAIDGFVGVTAIDTSTDMWICCALTDSALPALSTEKNSTVLVLETVKGPE